MFPVCNKWKKKLHVISTQNECEHSFASTQRCFSSAVLFVQIYLSYCWNLFELFLKIIWAIAEIYLSYCLHLFEMRRKILLCIFMPCCVTLVAKNRIKCEWELYSGVLTYYWWQSTVVYIMSTNTDQMHKTHDMWNNIAWNKSSDRNAAKNAACQNIRQTSTFFIQPNEFEHLIFYANTHRHHIHVYRLANKQIAISKCDAE